MFVVRFYFTFATFTLLTCICSSNICLHPTPHRTSGSGGATISTAAAHYLHVHHISRLLTVFGIALVCCIVMIVICAQNSNCRSKNCDDNNDDNDNVCDSENDEVESGGFIYAAVCLLVVLLSKWFLAFGKAALGRVALGKVTLADVSLRDVALGKVALANVSLRVVAVG